MFSESNSSSAKFGDSFSSFLPWSMDDVPKNFFVGAGILEKLLTEYSSSELRKMTKQHQILLPKINQMLRFFKQNAKTKKDSLKIQKYFQKREQIIRRLKFLRKFSRRNSNPTFMILKNLPVLPPDLRPILKLQNQIAASDLNRFYQRIIYRNDRFKKFAKDSATNQSFEIKYAQRLLQEAVDNLIQNGKGNVKAETNARGQPLKSLSEILKGKQGRFRQYLLGKRVDYSGRSVIVVGPELKLYECGLPKEMALELFLPFLIQYILQNKLAQTVVGAKNLLKSDSNLTLHLLHKVIQNIPILLNRAPTLHRLGFQAFLPKLIEGRAILLHPMVCPSFNADFDGDQMAVHIPLTVEARTEAWKFMLATNNLMNSATGEAIILPSQDMVLGCYYLTLDFVSKFVGVQLSNLLTKQNAFVPDLKQTIIHNKATLLQGKNFQKFVTLNKRFLFFNNFLFVLNAYERKEISLHTPVWVKWNSPVDFANEVAKPVEIRLQKNGSWEEIQPKYTTFYNHKHKQLQKVIRTTPGRILMNFMIQECSIL
jgi:DNA-directed RNA polymerase subunit beta'